MKKLLLALLLFSFVWISVACYTKSWYWVADHVPYTYEKDNTYWTQLSRIYRMKSAYLLNDIRKQNKLDTASDVVQLVTWKKYQLIVKSILDDETINQTTHWTLMFLYSRIQYKIDTLLTKYSDKTCTPLQIQQCIDKWWPDKEHCSIQ